MAHFPLYVHRDVDAWVAQHRTLAGRADWLLAELAARGYAGRPKGLIGPSREVDGLHGHRWRRSGLGGFDYYAWWFAAGEGLPFPPDSRVVRAVRPHDLVERLAPGDPAEYADRSFAELQPLTEEQACVVRSPARIKVAVGHPGTGKTGALLYAVLAEGRLNPAATLIYVTLSRGLADDAREFLGGLPELAGRVDVVTYEELLARWGPRDAGEQRAPLITDRAEEQAFRGFLADQPPSQLGLWQAARGALWAEVRAHLIGRALPFAFAARGQPACDQPFLPWDAYRRQRERVVGASAARSAWRLAQRFVEAYPRASLQRRAWDVLGRIEGRRLDRLLFGLDGLIVDEIQDLTPLQLAVLVEATRRMGELRAERPCFIAAGDESQVVHPSGFDWGIAKDLLRERLGADPEEFQLQTNQRSPSPLVEASNRTAALYDDIPKDFRPQAKVEAEKTEAQNGRVFVSTATSDAPELVTWLATLRDTPGSALVIVPGIQPEELAPILAESDFRDLVYEPALVKGLDRQYVVVWEASRALARLRDEVQGARSRGDHKPRYLAARRAVDEFRVAVSRSNETLVFLDRADTERDPLLQRLVQDRVAEEATPAHLNDILETRGHDPLDRTAGLLGEAIDLLDVDLPRALRALDRADAALEELHEPDSRLQAHERRIAARRRAADRLLELARAEDQDSETARELYRSVGKQLRSVEWSYRQVERVAQADRIAILADRYLGPVDDALDEEQLGFLLKRYLEAVEAMPEAERHAALDEARAWRRELEATGLEDYISFSAAVQALERLATLSGDPDDHAALVRLRERFIDFSVDERLWSVALEHIERLPAPDPARLAECYEGLHQWTAAADARMAAGDAEGALANLRQAGAVERAAELAGQLGQSELAESLTLVATFGRIGELDQAHVDVLTDAERQHLAEALRHAADRLAPRGRPAPPRKPDRSRRR